MILSSAGKSKRNLIDKYSEKLAIGDYNSHYFYPIILNKQCFYIDNPEKLRKMKKNHNYLKFIMLYAASIL